MTQPPHLKTLTVPQGAAGGAAPLATITWLHERGGERCWPLAPAHPTFAVGSGPGCAVQIESTYVSQLPCLIERRAGTRLRVRDNGSKNGTWFQDRREPEIELRAGDSFQIGMTLLLAATDAMHEARDPLRYYLGYEKARTTDDLLQWAVQAEHVVLIGEPGSGQEAAARLAHAVSARRSQPFVVLSDIPDGPAAMALAARHAHSTIFLPLGTLPPLREAFVEALVAGGLDTRLYAACASDDQLKLKVSTTVQRALRPVNIPPPRTRGGELRRMIDHAFAQRQLGFHAHDLGDRNLDALEAGGWLENVDELELVVERAGAILGAPSQRKAAERLGISHTTLSRWLGQRGLAFPVGPR